MDELNVSDFLNDKTYASAHEQFLTSLHRENFFPSATYPFGLFLQKANEADSIPRFYAWGCLVCTSDESECYNALVARTASKMTSVPMMKSTVLFHYLTHLYNLTNVGQEKCHIPENLPGNVSMIAIIESVLKKCFFCNRNAVVSEKEIMPGYCFITCDCDFRSKASFDRSKLEWWTNSYRRQSYNNNPDLTFDHNWDMTDYVESMDFFERLLFRELVMSPHVKWHEIGMGIMFAVLRARNVTLSILTRCRLNVPALHPTVTTPAHHAKRCKLTSENPFATVKCKAALKESGDPLDVALIDSFLVRNYLVHDVEHQMSLFFKYDYIEEPLIISGLHPRYFLHCKHERKLWSAKFDDIAARVCLNDDFPAPILLQRLAFMKVLVLFLHHTEDSARVSSTIPADTLPEPLLSRLLIPLCEAEKNKRFRLMLIRQLEASYFPSENKEHFKKLIRHVLKPQ